MTRKVNFINPFGTTQYDSLIQKTLAHSAGEGTELRITHLENCPADIDFFYSKHMVEQSLFEAVMRSADNGDDAIIIGCLYDPGVDVARELVDIPIVGPLEAAFQMASYFGHSTAILTDHRKAVAHMRDAAILKSQGNTVRGVDAIDWFVKDMIHDRGAVVEDVVRHSQAACEKFGSETVILGCTIIAAIYQEHLIQGGKPSPVPIINPNLLALKMAEGLADLNKSGAYSIARSGYYMRPEGHFESEFQKARSAWNASKPNFET